MFSACVPHALASWSLGACLLLALGSAGCGGKPAPDAVTPSTPSSGALPADAPPVTAPGESAAPASSASPAAAQPGQEEPEVSQVDPGDSGAFQLGAHHAKTVIEANRPFLNRGCWAAAVKNNPKGPAKVKLVIEAEVQPDGKVSKVALVGGKEYEGFAACVDKHVKRWRWPKAKAVSSLMFPIEFTHGEIEWRVKEPSK